MEKYEIQKLRDLPIEGVAERLKECVIPPLSKGRLGGDCTYKRTHAKHYTRQSPSNSPLPKGRNVK